VCFLEALKNAPRAIAFYQKMGFDIYHFGQSGKIEKILQGNNIRLNNMSHIMGKTIG